MANRSPKELIYWPLLCSLLRLRNRGTQLGSGKSLRLPGRTRSVYNQENTWTISHLLYNVWWNGGGRPIGWCPWCCDSSLGAMNQSLPQFLIYWPLLCSLPQFLIYLLLLCSLPQFLIYWLLLCSLPQLFIYWPLLFFTTIPHVWLFSTSAS
jgi:hypothetical protein